MFTEKGLNDTFERLTVGDFVELEVVPISECKYEPCDMCIVYEMGIDEKEKARKESELDVGNMFRFTGARYDIVIVEVNEKGRPTQIGILKYFVNDKEQPLVNKGIVVCPVLSWQDVGKLTLDGVSKLMPAFMVAVPNGMEDLELSNSVAAGMVVYRHIRAGK